MTTSWTPDPDQGAAHDAHVEALATWTDLWLTADDRRAWREQVG